MAPDPFSLSTDAVQTIIGAEKRQLQFMNNWLGSLDPNIVKMEVYQQAIQRQHMNPQTSHGETELFATTVTTSRNLSETLESDRKTKSPEEKLATIVAKTTRILERQFKKTAFVTKFQRERLSRKTKLTEKQIDQWFTNRRKRKHSQNQASTLCFNCKPFRPNTSFLSFSIDRILS